MDKLVLEKDWIVKDCLENLLHVHEHYDSTFEVLIG